VTGTISIIGQGYVGLPLAMAASQAGWRVFGIEIDPDRLELLRSGTSLVEDISDEQLQNAITSGNYQPSSSTDAVAESSVVVLCVPTPIDDFHEPDLSYLKSAITRFAPYLQEGTLVINESTSYVGTLRQLVRTAVSESNTLSIDSFDFASAPERIDPGNEEWHLMNTPRLVSGLTPTAHRRAVDFYKTFTAKVVEVSSPEVAEMAKLLENTFRLVNIGLVNELSVFTRGLGIDLREVVSAAASKPYGFMPFFPGPGIGGHCIPVDPYYLQKSLDSSGNSSRILESSLRINELRPSLVLETAMEISSNLRRLLLLGVAYKAGISDFRESAAEKITKDASARGIEVFWYDTLVKEWNFGKKWQGEEIDFAIYLVDQPNQLEVTEKIGCPLLDCTGALKGKPGAISL
jgi:UDP-N-acetyl-D-glucosamine dehydrogenase